MTKSAAGPLFDQHRLRSELENALPQHPLELVYLQSCDSTNRQCMQRALEGLIVISEHQSAGRGRRGKQWVSPQAQNLYASIGLSKTFAPQYLGLISLLVGVSIASSLRQNGYQGVALKWPNDILLEGKKLGGILIETRAKSAQEFYLVIGIGLNLHLSQLDQQQIDQPAIALSQVSDVSCDQQQLVTDVLGKVYQSVREFEVAEFDTLLQHFNEFDYLKGKPVLVKTQREEINGDYAGIQADGQICINVANQLRSFAAAEISIREVV